MTWIKKLIAQVVAAGFLSSFPLFSIVAASAPRVPTLNEIRAQLADVDTLEPSRHVDLARVQLDLCVKKRGLKHIETMACQVDLGEAQLAEMFFTDAEATLRATVAALDRTPPSAQKIKITARAHSLFGAVLTNQSKYAEARALLEKALAAQQSPSIERFRTLARLSALFDTMELRDELDKNARATKTEADRLPKMSVTDRALLAATEARLACSASKDVLCYRRWESVLALMETTYSKTDSRLTLALEPLMLAYNFSRDRERGEAISERILQIERIRPRQNNRRLGSVLGDLGGIYLGSNRLALAEQVQRQAVTLAESDPSSKLPLAIRLSNFGATLTSLGKYREAENALRRSVELTVAIFGKDNPNSTFPRKVLAEVLATMGKTSEAVAINAENVRILSLALGPNHIRTIFAMHYQGSFLLGNSQAIEAKAVLSFALDAARSTFGPKAEDTLNILTTYSAALLATDDADGALREARSVLSEIRANALGNATSVQKKSGPANGLAISQNAAKRLRHVLFKIALKNEDAIGDAFFIQQFIERSSDGTAAWRTGARLTAKDPALRRLAEDQQVAVASVAKLRNQLATAYQAKNGPEIDRLSTALEENSAALAATTASIDARYPAFANLAGGHDLPLQQLTAPNSMLIKRGEAALFLIQDREAHYALIVKRGFLRIARVEISVAEMAALVAKLRKGIAIANAVTASDLPKFDLETSHALYQKIIGPFEAGLRGVTKLYVSIDGVLTSLPLSLLVTKMPRASNDDYEAYRRASWFGDKHTIVMLPAINALQALKLLVPPSKADRSLLAIADPALDGTGSNKTADALTSLRSAQAANSMPGRTAAAVCALRSLPDTRREAQAMAQAMNAPADALLFGNVASESALAARSQSGELRRYRTLLFATHGLVAGSSPSEEPAIVLTPTGGCGGSVAASSLESDDGLLTASEIATLSLDADVVILSGCNTAVGEASGADRPLSGLTRAFIYAGARQIVVSHWSVDSAATADLMSSMARKQIGGSSYPAALQAAMRAMRTNHAAQRYRSHPAFWAAFTVVGDGR